MNSTMTWKTAQTPSAFGMPICGHAFRLAARASEVNSALATTLVIRDRAVLAGTNGAVKAYFPGTNAWSPPTC